MIFFFSREQTVSKICEDVGVAVWWFHCSLVVDSSRDGIHCQHCGNPRSIFIFNFYKFFFFKFGLIDRVFEFFLCSSNLYPLYLFFFFFFFQTGIAHDSVAESRSSTTTD